MNPKFIALAILIAFAIAIATFLTGCVSFPIPPVGDDAGKLGRLELKLVYIPNVSGTINYLWDKQQPKPTSSK